VIQDIGMAASTFSEYKIFTPQPFVTMSITHLPTIFAPLHLITMRFFYLTCLAVAASATVINIQISTGESIAPASSIHTKDCLDDCLDAVKKCNDRGDMSEEEW
jgi:hypothetical protein